MPTLTEPTADAQKIDIYGRRVHAADSLDIVPGVKYALVLLRLNSAVTPSDYGALKTSVEAIPGITEAQLVIDNQNAGGTVTTTSSVPAGKKLVAVIETRLRIEDDTP